MSPDLIFLRPPTGDYESFASLGRGIEYLCNRLGSAQCTSEQEPRFSSSNDALAMPAVAFRLRYFLFSLRPTLSRGQHCTLPDPQAYS
jgi:hypothetical protein